jgi:cob(I)alamin adenosyltransferase
VCEATREAVQQVEDVAMSLVSPEVTRHLVNAQQELLRAGIRVASLASGSAEKWGQKAIDALESKAGRAEQLHAGRKRPTSSNPSS